MSMQPHEQNPADTYAALKMLEAGLAPIIAEAKQAAHDYADKVGAKSLRTPYGPVTIAVKKPTIGAVDEKSLLDWAQEYRPDVVTASINPRHPDHDKIIKWVEANHPSAVKYGVEPLWVEAQKKALTIVDGEAIIPETGEVADWATVKPGSEYVTAPLTAVAKLDAVEQVRDRLGALLDAATGQQEIAKPEQKQASKGFQVFGMDIHASQWLTENHRLTRYPKAERISTLRGKARLTSRDLTPVTSLSEIVATIHYPTNAKADPPNSSPTVKAMVDGLVDSGVIPDDNSDVVKRTSYVRGDKTGIKGLYRINLALIP